MKKYSTVYLVKEKRIYEDRIVEVNESIYTSYSLAQESLIDTVNWCVNNERAKGKLRSKNQYDRAELVLEFAEDGNYGEKCTVVYTIESILIFTDDDIKWEDTKIKEE